MASPSMSSFGKVVGGKLKLKTVAKPPPTAAGVAAHGGLEPLSGVKRPRPSETAGGSGGGGSGGGSGSTASGGGALTSAAGTAPKYTEPSREEGKGRITTSGTTVQGVGTDFSAHLRAGDAVEVLHPVTGRPEVRVVKMVVSNVALGINTPFSADLIHPTSYWMLKLPRLIETEEMRLEAASKRRREEEVAAYGGLASDGGQKFTYHEKLGGVYNSYKVVTVKLDESTTRESLLDMRSKKKSDKYC